MKMPGKGKNVIRSGNMGKCKVLIKSGKILKVLNTHVNVID